LTLVANRPVRIPQSSYITFLRVASGLDAADNEIVDKIKRGDLVITSDIPLAAKVVEKEALALSPRGEVYSVENIHERLSTRDFLDTLRSSGIETGGPPALSSRDRHTFANRLDQLLRKNIKKA
jgi:uncharacterized protein YaiI (UPF0178 family)